MITKDYEIRVWKHQPQNQNDFEFCMFVSSAEEGLIEVAQGVYDGWMHAECWYVGPLAQEMRHWCLSRG